MTFINREAELSFLEEAWQSPKAQFVVLWGKRRVGKTELVKKFIADKPHIYFLSESTHDREQLSRFSTALGKFFLEPLLTTRGFAGWEESFEYVRDKKIKFVLAIDEFPYLIQSNPAIPGLFQKAWDEYWSKSGICLILLGSSIAMMESEVLGYTSPLYGRRTGQWRVEPMDFEAVRKFRSSASFEDRLFHYALAGGIPAYWLQFDRKIDFSHNLKLHVLKKGRALYDEVEFILREELREPRYYFALLQAVAQGKRKLSEIVNATGISQPTANKYLGVLADLGIVERELPVTEDKPLKSKKGLYLITDEFFGFWFSFIFPRRSELEMNMTEAVLKDIMGQMPHYVSRVYEKISREMLRKHSDLFFPFSAVGRWWDKNEEIDLVAVNPALNSILFCEVKWSKKPVGVDIYEALRTKAKLITWGKTDRKEFYCLFSKKGFTDAMIKLAKKDGVVLFRENRPLSGTRQTISGIRNKKSGGGFGPPPLSTT
jgi:uncharacterized protein